MTPKDVYVNVTITDKHIVASTLGDAKVAVTAFYKLPKIIRWLLGESLNRSMERLNKKIDVAQKKVEFK